MKIPTSRFGVLEFEPEVFIHFPWGIPGFESLKRYVLLEHHKGPFQWLQAVDDPDVAFVVCPPEVFNIRYEVPPEQKAMLELDDEKDLAVLIMVSFDRSNKRVRPHMRTPLLFNASNRRGIQWALDARDFKRRVCFQEKSDSTEES